MPFGDPQGNFAGTGGYGGQFGGFGGASAGYTGGYGNPSSVGQGTAGQTYAGQAYANTLNKHNPTLPNYSGTTNSVSGPSGSGGISLSPSKKKNVTAAQQAEIQARIKAAKAQSAAFDAMQLGGVDDFTDFDDSDSWPNNIQSYPNVQSGGFFPGTSRNVTPSSAGATQGSWNLGSHPTTQTQLNGNFGSGNLGNGNFGSGNLGNGNFGSGNLGNLGVDQNVFGGRQFGGPVAPGQQYTVGENGPETLQMRPGGGGQVIPNNPMDRMQGGFPGGAGQPGMGGGAGQLGGMNPQMMQALFQMIQQRKQGQQGGGMQRPPMPQPSGGGLPTPGMGGGMQRPQTQGPGGGSFRLGDWRNRMGIEGLSRPPQSMGFGGSGLGIPGVMGQMRNRMG